MIICIETYNHHFDAVIELEDKNKKAPKERWMEFDHAQVPIEQSGR
jgi:hypothetical protein